MRSEVLLVAIWFRCQVCLVQFVYVCSTYSQEPDFRIDFSVVPNYPLHSTPSIHHPSLTSSPQPPHPHCHTHTTQTDYSQTDPPSPSPHTSNRQCSTRLHSARYADNGHPGGTVPSPDVSSGTPACPCPTRPPCRSGSPASGTHSRLLKSCNVDSCHCSTSSRRPRCWLRAAP